MFGSKLRSWMETHIVRPRKKNNKNKQAEGVGSGSGSVGSSSHAKKAGTLPANSNLKSTTSPVLTSSGSHSIASPVRRREVSPIQCHVSCQRHSKLKAISSNPILADAQSLWLAIAGSGYAQLHYIAQVG